MDPTQVSSLGSFAEKFGFSAMLVLVLLYGIYKMNEAHRKEREMRDEAILKERETRDERDEKREAERRAERKESMDAHLGALGKQTEVISTLGTSLVRLETKVDTLGRDVGTLKGRVKKFDPEDTDPGVAR
jgi:hypothetical protein